MRMGVICPSEIAFRRFMPALQQVHGMEFVGVGVSTEEERFGVNCLDIKTVRDNVSKDHVKANEFIKLYGGKIFNGYDSIIRSKEIDAIYIPLPPALHYHWAKVALECGKHVLVEKPSTIYSKDTAELIQIARGKGLALHENYMFSFHEQLKDINEIINNGEIGDVRLYRIAFGFPMRKANDFRYNKKLGGGVLIDAGGYTIKYASMLLGATAKLRYAQMNYLDGFEVDMYGSAAMTNDEGVTAQIAFGMDNNYKCELEVWGRSGCLTTGRVLTAPAGFEPTATIRKGSHDTVVKLSADDAFKKSIERFIECIYNPEVRENNYKEILQQAEIVDSFYSLAKQ